MLIIENIENAEKYKYIKITCNTLHPVVSIVKLLSILLYICMVIL